MHQDWIAAALAALAYMTVQISSIRFGSIHRSARLHRSLLKTTALYFHKKNR